MPFKKVGKDNYTGPSGRHFNAAQVRLYYAHGGSFPAHADGGPVMANGYAKGGAVQDASYASGGPVLGRTREFLKEPDRFRTSGTVDGKWPKTDKPEPTEDAFPKSGKTGSLSKPSGDKCLPTVKPRC